MADTNEFQFVDRPAPYHSGLSDALMATLENGRAVVVPGPSASIRAHSVRSHLQLKGLKVRTRTINGVLHAWVERREPAEEPPRG